MLEHGRYQQNMTDTRHVRMLTVTGKCWKGEADFANRMLLGRFEVTSAVVQYVENTGRTLYMIQRYITRATHNKNDT